MSKLYIHSNRPAVTVYTALARASHHLLLFDKVWSSERLGRLAAPCASHVALQLREMLPGYHPLPRLPAQVRAQLAKQLGAAGRHAQPAHLPIVVIQGSVERGQVSEGKA